MKDKQKPHIHDPEGETMDSSREQHPHDAAMEDPFETHDSHHDDLQHSGSEIEQLRAAVDEANRRALMAHAEMENARKRMRRDYEDQLKYATMPLLKDLIPGLDNLQRAIAAAKGNEQATGLSEGVSMVAKQIQDTLAKHECHAIPTDGELFDPNYHEAISQMASDQVAEGVVAHTAVVGYQLHDRVVRPSQVIVSTGPTT